MFAEAAPDCVMEVDVVSVWGVCLLPNTVKPKACKPTLPAVLIGQSEWGPVRSLAPRGAEWTVER